MLREVPTGISHCTRTATGFTWKQETKPEHYTVLVVRRVDRNAGLRALAPLPKPLPAKIRQQRLRGQMSGRGLLAQVKLVAQNACGVAMRQLFSPAISPLTRQNLRGQRMDR